MDSVKNNAHPQSSNNDAIHNANIYKKIGPLVPPKPMKKAQQENMPEVPYSIQVKQICEPRYSQRLQSSAENQHHKGADILQLQRKQSAYTATGTFSNNRSKVTLDNPDVLDQQLEALAYHKKQLEKKKLMPQYHQSSLLHSNHSTCIPKLSSTSLINEPKKQTVNNHTYSNVHALTNNFNMLALREDQREPASQANVYGNLAVHPEVSNSNILYGKTRLSLNLYEDNYCFNRCNEQEEEMLPPPSPVSSSYSELRRANEIFSNNQQQQKQQQKHVPITENVAAFGNLQKSRNDMPQKEAYMNLKFIQQDALGYSPTLQNFNKDAADYYCFGGSSSQGSLTYESIYEPINPRPSSQLSIQSSYLELEQLGNPNARESKQNLRAGATNPEQNSAEKTVYPLNQKEVNTQKEHEVEALTEFLVHSMDSEPDLDTYGICYKCNKRVVGENSGCTAMDQVYHIVCFTCTQCQINLQGKPFYALEGKPFCEVDYLQTLEKCSVCMKPILERILRATGKPYHPQCFTCIVCSKSLDGIPFTVDATNQNYCIADFHKKFAPRCCVCKEPIMPDPGEDETVRVVALDRSFHFECYKCEDCGLLLSSEAEGRGCYPLDDHVLCKSCNAKRVQMLTSNMTTEL